MPWRVSRQPILLPPPTPLILPRPISDSSSLFPLEFTSRERAPSVSFLTDTCCRSLHSRYPASPHSSNCHWQIDLNGGIKSIRSNGTRYIRSKRKFHGGRFNRNCNTYTHIYMYTYIIIYTWVLFIQNYDYYVSRLSLIQISHTYNNIILLFSTWNITPLLI